MPSNVTHPFQHDSRVHLLIDARLGFRNKGDPEGEWKEYAASFANRNLDCDIDEVSFFGARNLGCIYFANFTR